MPGDNQLSTPSNNVEDTAVTTSTSVGDVQESDSSSVIQDPDGISDPEREPQTENNDASDISSNLELENNNASSTPSEIEVVDLNEEENDSISSTLQEEGEDLNIEAEVDNTTSTPES